ncbi:DUF2442 domain-containing protein [Leptospira kanakyensis]|uniref:DUF2442 domain-containing protein n=1 Tax=Leptospira kanakyensis TaxID=2484968 RepID=A0A6N4Q8D2_9LEPT|nr:DUF2442 domain-containing protein [Leptospira kanakyensis]TGK47677.1 DUF2442 domain-containing protein [Leptospira kanakyensis]TGK63320.1 DUF2442 domain-containing protein [Leptospira kanakyensis]TGK66927.1 DUF2442 domain-containing protein [Leptospira kanakyensis]
MNSLISEAKAQKIWFDDDNLWISLYDGRSLSVPLAFFPRLRKAKKEQLDRFEISGGGIGIHWEELDEDISVAGLLLGTGDLSSSKK